MFSLPLTSAENLAECRETKSFSSWSKLQSIRFVSHERIPASQRKKGKNMKCVVLFINHEENSSLRIDNTGYFLQQKLPHLKCLFMSMKYVAVCQGEI